MSTILVVDADAGTSGIDAILRRRGFSGIRAAHAHEALVHIKSDPSIDLVITEMQLPDMNGLDFLAAVKSAAPRLPIIVVTGSGSIENYLHAVNLGVYEYLNKPVLPKELARIAGIAMGSIPASPMHEAS